MDDDKEFPEKENDDSTDVELRDMKKANSRYRAQRYSPSSPQKSSRIQKALKRMGFKL